MPIRHHGREMRDVSRDLAMPATLECDKSVMAGEWLLQKEQRERMQLAMRDLTERAPKRLGAAYNNW